MELPISSLPTGRTPNGTRRTRRTTVSRRTTLSTVATAIAGLSGCVGWFRPPKAKPVVNSSATQQIEYVAGQPTFADAPTVSGWLSTRPEEMNDILRWDQLYEPLRESMRQAQERFEHGTHFFTALVGVLEFGFGLDDYEEPRIEDRTIRFFTRPGDQNLGTFEPTANYPEYNYDYSFVLWKLRDDVDPPTDIEVTFKRQLKSTDSG